MTGHKTLIAYASKGGATKEAALEIVKILRDRHKLAVDEADLRKDDITGISEYSNIVAGAGVRTGKIYGEFWKLLDNDLSGRKLALFIVCGEAGDPKDHDRVLEKHKKTILSKHPDLKPVEMEVFGGRMKILWKVVSDGRDMNRVREWAESVGKKFAGK